jgi:hypothetical protein
LTDSYVCPVCGFDKLARPPVDEDGDGLYGICPSCGFQFGVTDDDEGFTYASWRAKWVSDGMTWDSWQIRPAPEGWDPKRQLEKLLGGNTE